MRFEMTFHTYVEVFNRLVSLRFDPKDWEFRIQNTESTTIIYAGPFHIGYTNQHILNKRIQEMIASIDKDFEDYQVKTQFDDTTTEIPSGPNILH